MSQKYNTTLETLDISSNPCCGGGLSLGPPSSSHPSNNIHSSLTGGNLEGVTALRSAFAFNTSLMRIFLNNTDLSSAGAIALAEFLPEVQSLIHIDLTDNADVSFFVF